MAVLVNISYYMTIGWLILLILDCIFGWTTKQRQCLYKSITTLLFLGSLFGWVLSFIWYFLVRSIGN